MPRFNDIFLVGIVLTCYLFTWQPAAYLLGISVLVSAWVLPPNGSLLVVGCSFTFGWGVSDEETFAARLQERLPLQVVNHGVTGYGTYQSLLLLERLLAEGPVPSRILYAYADGHELRNVAHPLWTYSLTKFSRHGMVAVPFCELGTDGKLYREAPEHYPDWPLKRQLASMAFLELKYMQLTRWKRVDEAPAVTELLLREMVRVARRYGSDFHVVFLNATDYSPEIKASKPGRCDEGAILARARCGCDRLLLRDHAGPARPRGRPSERPDARAMGRLHRSRSRTRRARQLGGRRSRTFTRASRPSPERAADRHPRRRAPDPRGHRPARDPATVGVLPT